MVIISDDVYLPREDSYQLKEAVEEFAAGRVLEVGIGSGIQILTAAGMNSVSEAVGVDLNPKALLYAKKELNRMEKSGEIRDGKTSLIKSNLFSKVEGKYDTIIFNPPYLPDHPDIKDLALDGGPKGYELTDKFLNEVNNYLTKTGIILLLFSSLTKKDVIDDILDNNALTSTFISERTMDDGEILYVYKIEKSLLLRDLESHDISNIVKFAKGKRGIIFTGDLNGEKVAIKFKRPDSEAPNSINNEINVLDYFHNEGLEFIPHLRFTGHDYFVYDFIEGIFIGEFSNKSTKKGIIDVLIQVFDAMFALDTLGYNKLEMNHPHKHILIREERDSIVDFENKKVKKGPKRFIVKLVDFERCKRTDKPKNVTQFVQYVTSTNYSPRLTKKKINVDSEKIRKLANSYKRKMSEENYKKIISELK